MKKLTVEELLDEIRQQNRALEQLKSWIMNLAVLTLLLAILAGWGLRGTGIQFAAGVACTVGAVFLAVLCVLIGYGYRRGRKNVQKLNHAAETQKKACAS